MEEDQIKKTQTSDKVWKYLAFFMVFVSISAVLGGTVFLLSSGVLIDSLIFSGIALFSMTFGALLIEWFYGSDQKPENWARAVSMLSIASSLIAGALFFPQFFNPTVAISLLTVSVVTFAIGFVLHQRQSHLENRFKKEPEKVKSSVMSVFLSASAGLSIVSVSLWAISPIIYDLLVKLPFLPEMVAAVLPMALPGLFIAMSFIVFVTGLILAVKNRAPKPEIKHDELLVQPEQKKLDAIEEKYSEYEQYEQSEQATAKKNFLAQKRAIKSMEVKVEEGEDLKYAKWVKWKQKELEKEEKEWCENDEKYEKYAVPANESDHKRPDRKQREQSAHKKWEACEKKLKQERLEWKNKPEEKQEESKKEILIPDNSLLDAQSEEEKKYDFKNSAVCDGEGSETVTCGAVMNKDSTPVSEEKEETKLLLSSDPNDSQTLKKKKYITLENSRFQEKLRKMGFNGQTGQIDLNVLGTSTK